MHLSDEQLHSYLDKQLDRADRAVDHLNTCAACRTRLDAIQSRSARVSMHLASLDPRATEAPRAPHLAYAWFTQRHRASRKEGFTMRSAFSARTRPLWIGLSAIVLLAVAFSFPPVQTWAGDLLALFRVQKVVVLPVDTTRLNEIGGNTAMGKQVSQLFSDSIKITKEPGKPKSVANAAAATQAAGFTVRLPSSRTDAPQITVQESGAFQFVINRARAQSLLDEAGFKQYRLPASLDGALVKVDVPASVTAAYGDCPKPESDKSTSARQPTTCVIIAQLPSPTVNAPPDLDVEQLAIIGLQFVGMTEQQAREYSKTVDWTSTLVIPIPRNGTSYKQVTADGVTGYLIQQSGSYVPQYALVWVKQGIIYGIGGYGMDTSAAMAMGASMK
jgi:hypothetical protein